MTVRELLWQARSRFTAPIPGQTSSPDLDTRILLGHVIGVDPASIPARLNEVVSPPYSQAFQALWERRLAGEPVAYLTGNKEFWGREFEVGPGVLVPRPDTETLVEWVLDDHGLRERLKLLDLCTGSGCIAITLAAEKPGWEVACSDISRTALETATRNAARLLPGVRVGAAGPGISFHLSNLFADLPDQIRRPDIVTANPPYLTKAEWADLEAGGWVEPALALVSGEDGLDLIREIVAQAAGLLRKGAYLYIENGSEQAQAVLSLMSEAGFTDTQSRTDIAGRARVCRGIR